jgi:hypothetical protein
MKTQVKLFESFESRKKPRQTGPFALNLPTRWRNLLVARVRATVRRKGYFLHGFSFAGSRRPSATTLCHSNRDEFVWKTF